MKCRVGLLTILIAGACLNAVAFEQTISLVDGTLSSEIIQSKPTRNIEKVDDGYIVTYNIETAVLSGVPNDSVGVRWSIPYFNANYIEGEPATLFRNDMFEVPEGKKCEVTLLDASYIDVPGLIVPSQSIRFVSETVTHNKISPINAFDGYFPQNIVVGIDGGTYGKQKIAFAHISPIQYNYKNQTVRSYNRISYKVTYYDDSNNINHGLNKISEVVDFQSDEALATKKDSLKVRPRQNLQNEVTRDYLILTTTNLLPAAKRLAEWKKLMGFRVHIEHRDKGNWLDSDDVFEVVNEYCNAYDNLYHLLIIGKNEHVPGDSTSQYLGRDEANHIYNTDSFLEEQKIGTSELRSICVGRLPVAGIYDANVVVDKIINYEKSPTRDYNFYQNAVHCAQFSPKDYPDDPGEEKGMKIRASEEIGIYMQTKQHLNISKFYRTERNVYPQSYDSNFYVGNNEIPDGLKKPNYDWDSATAEDLARAINKGALYTIALTHGSVNMWHGINFSHSHVEMLDNKDKPTLVFSMGCNTGNLTNKELKAIAEELLTHNGGGAIGVIAPAEESISGWNEAMLCGMINSIWPTPGLNLSLPDEKIPDGLVTLFSQPEYELGKILMRGRLRMSETIMLGKDPSYEQGYIKSIFHLYGDPSLRLTTESPKAFRNVEVQRITNYVNVNLGDTKATITFYDRSSGNVKAYYGNKAKYKCLNSRKVDVCISNHNYVPFIDEAVENPYYEEVLYLQGGESEFSTSETTILPYETIKIGSNVNPYDDVVTDPVTILKGSVIFKTKNLMIYPDFTILPESDVTFTH